MACHSFITQTASLNITGNGGQDNKAQHQDIKALLQSLENLFLNETFADVYFKCQSGDGKDVLFPAHKQILAMRSSVFQAMFYGGFDDGNWEIEILDIPDDVLKSFLRYIYTAEVTIDGNTVIQLLYTADKYQVTALKQQCQQYLEKNLNVENACTIMNSADMFNMHQLITKTLQFISKNAKNVFKTEEFTALSPANMKRILTSDALTSSEVEVFAATVRWATQQCRSKSLIQNTIQVRKVLGDLFYEIRLTSMTLDEFSIVVVKSGMLTDQEQLQFYKFFTIKEKGSEVVKFASKARIGTNVELTLKLNPNSNFNRSYVSGRGAKSCEQINVRITNPYNLNLRLTKIEIAPSVISSSKCSTCNVSASVFVFVVEINTQNGSEMFNRVALDSDNRHISVKYLLKKSPVLYCNIETLGSCSNCGSTKLYIYPNKKQVQNAQPNTASFVKQNIELIAECTGHYIVESLKFENI